MKKTFSLMGLLALLAMPTTLSAQSIFKFTWNDMRGGSYPRQIDERKLAEYCFGSWKCNSLLNLFKQDTVPLQEMKERFYSTVNTKRRTRYFPQNDSVTAIRGVQDVLVNSPLATCPIKKARNMRGVWSYPHLRLVELLDENGKKDSALYRKVADTFTPNVEGYRQGFPTWFEGNVIKLRSPMWYMDFVVSAQPWFYHYEKGKVIIDECDSDCPDYFSSYPRIFDGTWVDNLMEGMPFFSDAINRDITPFKAPSVSFTFLLHIKADYACDIELLLPRELDGDTKKAFEELRNYMTHLRRGLFKPLYTLDGRVFPGRYMQAWHDSHGWEITDLIATNPNIPERRKQ